MKTTILLLMSGLLLAGCATSKPTVYKQPPGPTLTEIQNMVNAHVSDSVIIPQIENSSTRYNLTADQIISLKDAGVSDAVINALIKTASKHAPQTKIVTYYVYPYGYYGYPYWGWGPDYYGGYYHGGRHW